jgi:predicted  nucleic acid-binding Zn-ribbon protein
MKDHIRLLEDRVVRVVDRLKRLTEERDRLQDEVRELRDHVEAERLQKVADGRPDAAWQEQHAHVVDEIRAALVELRGD